MKEIYLYAVVRGRPGLKLGRMGLPDGQGAVSTVDGGGVVGLVSTYGGPAFNALSKHDRLRHLAIHQQVAKAAMDSRKVLPAKFGTIVASREQVAITLARFRSRLNSPAQFTRLP